MQLQGHHDFGDRAVLVTLEDRTTATVRARVQNLGTWKDVDLVSYSIQVWPRGMKQMASTQATTSAVVGPVPLTLQRGRGVVTEGLNQGQGP